MAGLESSSEMHGPGGSEKLLETGAESQTVKTTKQQEFKFPLPIKPEVNSLSSCFLLSPHGSTEVRTIAMSPSLHAEELRSLVTASPFGTAHGVN